jgi:hypothetical protein
MKQRTVQTLYSYWNDLRAGRIAPPRLEIEPARIAALLPETFMLERVGPTTFNFRLAGTRLCEIFGTELRGADMLAGWSPSDRAAIAADLETTCEAGAVTRLTVEASADPTHRVQLEVIMLPLMHSTNKIERIIGAMSPLTAPHWLGYERLGAKRLIDHDLIWPDGEPQVLLDGTGSQDGRQPFIQPLAAPGRTVRSERRLFRVFEGGRKA